MKLISSLIFALNHNLCSPEKQEKSGLAGKFKSMDVQRDLIRQPVPEKIERTKRFK